MRIQDAVDTLLLEDLQIEQIDLRILVVDAEDRFVMVPRNSAATACAIAV